MSFQFRMLEPVNIFRERNSANKSANVWNAALSKVFISEECF